MSPLFFEKGFGFLGAAFADVEIVELDRSFGSPAKTRGFADKLEAAGLLGLKLPASLEDAENGLLAGLYPPLDPIRITRKKKRKV